MERYKHVIIQSDISFCLFWRTVPSPLTNGWQTIFYNLIKIKRVMIFAPDNITPKFRQFFGGLALSDRNDMRNLGVIFDRALCFNSHINSVVRSCFFHLRNTAQIRSIVSIKEIEILVHGFISSRLDYCNPP